jgi:hypothetical protein
MYSLLYFIGHPIDVSNATISGLIDWIKEEERKNNNMCIYSAIFELFKYLVLVYMKMN